MTWLARVLLIHAAARSTDGLAVPYPCQINIIKSIKKKKKKDDSYLASVVAQPINCQVLQISTELTERIHWREKLQIFLESFASFFAIKCH